METKDLSLSGSAAYKLRIPALALHKLGLGRKRLDSTAGEAMCWVCVLIDFVQGMMERSASAEGMQLRKRVLLTPKVGSKQKLADFYNFDHSTEGALSSSLPIHSS